MFQPPCFSVSRSGNVNRTMEHSDEHGAWHRRMEHVCRPGISMSHHNRRITRQRWKEGRSAMVIDEDPLVEHQNRPFATDDDERRFSSDHARLSNQCRRRWMHDQTTPAAPHALLGQDVPVWWWRHQECDHEGEWSNVHAEPDRTVQESRWNKPCVDCLHHSNEGWHHRGWSSGRRMWLYVRERLKILEKIQMIPPLSPADTWWWLTHSSVHHVCTPPGLRMSCTLAVVLPVRLGLQRERGRFLHGSFVRWQHRAHLEGELFRRRYNLEVRKRSTVGYSRNRARFNWNWNVMKYWTWEKDGGLCE